MSDRTLQLVIQASDKASAQIKAIREELEKIQGLQGLGANQGFQAFNQQAEIATNRLGGFAAAGETAFKAVGAIGSGSILAGIGGIALAFNQTTESVERLIAASRQAYNFLIASNEVYQKQLLSAQAAIANSSRITVNGREITDTVEKIQSLRETVQKTFDLVQRETESIADLTTADVNEIFTSVISNYSKLQSQLKTDKLKEFDKTLNSNEATLARLSGRFAAFAKINQIDTQTLNVGIRNILSGTNVNESLLAQRIGLTQQDVQQYQARGTLVLELLKRLEGAGKASALQSNNPGSNFTNIIDTFQRIGRQAGEPLFNALGQVAQEAFQSLQAIEPQLTAFFKGISQGIVDVFAQLAPLGDGIGKVFGQIGQSFSQVSKDVDEIKQAISPVTNAFGELGQTVGAVLGPLSGLKSVFDFLKDGVIQLLNPIQGFLDALKVGTFVVDSFKNTIVTAFNLVGGQVAGVVNGINTQIKALVSNQAFQAFAKAAGINIDEVNKSLAQMDAQQKQATQSAKELSKANKEIKPMEAPDLGTINSQIDAALKNARDRFKETSRDTFAQDFKTGLDAYKTAVEAGRISTQEALKDLEALQTRRELNPEQAAQVAQEIARIRKQGLDRQLADEKATQAQIEAETKLGIRSQEQGAKDLSEAKRKQLQTQLDDTKAAIVAEQQAIAKGGGSTNRLQELQSKQKELNAQLVNEEISGRDRVQQARERETSIQKANLDAQIKQTQAAAQAGTIGQVEAAKKVTELKKQQLDQQLQNINKAIADEQAAQARGDGSPQRLAELEAKRKAILADRKQSEVDSEKQIQEAALKEVERAQSRATALAKLAETQRLQDIQQLLNEGVIRKEEAEEQKLQAARKSIEEELKIAQEGVRKLEAVPKSNDPRTESDRQKLIRDARQRTSDLTLKLLENERAQQEATFAIVQRKLQDQSIAAQTAANQQKVALEQQRRVIDIANRSLERRSQLLSAQKELVSATASLQQSRYQGAIDLLQSQFETEDKILDRQKQRVDLQKRLAEGDTNAAQELADLDRRENRERALNALRIEAKQKELESLNLQQALEQQSLILEQQKTKLLEKQEEIRLRINLAEAKAQQAQAIADAAKTAANPNATAAEKAAAQQQVVAAGDRVAGTQELIEFQRQSAAQTDALFAQRAQALAITQQQQREQKGRELQTLQNQQFGLSPLQQGTPEDIANQRAVAAEDARRRASVQAEEARQRGFSTPLQQAQQARLNEQAQGQFLTTGGIGAQGSAGLQEQSLLNARSPLINLASQQTTILADSQKMQESANQYLNQIVGLLQQGQRSPGGVNINQDIRGQIDPREAANQAARQVTDALKTAFNQSARR